jgi:hypothetical protein
MLHRNWPPAMHMTTAASRAPRVVSGPWAAAELPQELRLGRDSGSAQKTKENLTLVQVCACLYVVPATELSVSHPM